MLDTALIPEAHRYFAVQCFNDCWTYIEKPDRSSDDTLMMIHLAHASAYHWTQRADTKPENRARSFWQISRVYCVAGHAGAAQVYGQICLRICEEHGIGDWDIAFAYEALARAAAALGDAVARDQWLLKAREATALIKEDGDREAVEADLATIPVG